ncbi:MAG: hypothetical protein U0164_09430 [Gemmatimonadaceae bacterium]
MHASHALHRDNPALAQRRDRRLQRRLALSVGDWRPSPLARHESCGPHAGQALGCAWKRRFPGSSYSRWHASHITKPAMVVMPRSYGTSRTMV